MEAVSKLFIIAKIVGLLIAPAVTTLVTIIRFICVKRKNGSVIYRKREFDLASLVPIIILFAPFGFLILRAQNASELLKFSLIFVGISSTWILVFTAALMKGIYEKMIIQGCHPCEQ